MNEQEVRALVREAIERHLGRPEKGVRGLTPFSGAHPSHIILEVRPGSETDDGMCVIEPAVRCTHCGFCQSYGH
jgi:hypothetical protein